LPYNAHTTTSDALWVGVPVLTLPGRTFASRVAGSLLQAVGLPELIATTRAEYESLAVRLAADTREIGALRAKLEGVRQSAPLFDTPRMVKDIEMAYERMWERYERGEAPDHIAVGP
jgi:protein O-GlcNAc transferase